LFTRSVKHIAIYTGIRQNSPGLTDEA